MQKIKLPIVLLVTACVFGAVVGLLYFIRPTTAWLLYFFPPPDVKLIDVPISLVGDAILTKKVKHNFIGKYDLFIMLEQPPRDYLRKRTAHKTETFFQEVKESIAHSIDVIVRVPGGEILSEKRIIDPSFKAWKETASSPTQVVCWLAHFSVVVPRQRQAIRLQLPVKRELQIEIRTVGTELNISKRLGPAILRYRRARNWK